MTRLRFLSIALVLALIGCNDAEMPRDSTATVPAAKMARRGEAPPAASAAADKLGPARTLVTDGAVATLVATQPGAAPAAVARKIIYDAQVDLIVKSVDPIAKRVGTLLQDARGYIAEQTVTGSPGSLRAIRWRFRVPVEQFDSFLDAIVSLGELERNNRTSQDVTEQYYDIEARIKNKKLEEQTLNKLLQERSGKLEDVLKIEIELSRVRGEIEQLEGKIRVLENLSSLATLTLNIREREKYEPPPPAVADFSTKVARAWNDSLVDLVNLGKSVVLWTVTWAVWIPFWVAGAFLAWVLIRWLKRVLRAPVDRTRPNAAQPAAHADGQRVSRGNETMPHERLNRNAPCPCGSGKKYKNCCSSKGFEWVQDEEGRVSRSVPLTAESFELLDQLRQAFIDERGRAPEPEDLLFPAMPHMEHLEASLVTSMKQAGLHPAVIYAFEKTGYVVTAENQHLIPDKDLEAWKAAVAEYDRKHSRRRRPIKFPRGR